MGIILSRKQLCGNADLFSQYFLCCSRAQQVPLFYQRTAAPPRPPLSSLLQYCNWSALQSSLLWSLVVGLCKSVSEPVESREVRIGFGCVEVCMSLHSTKKLAHMVLRKPVWARYQGQPCTRADKPFWHPKNLSTRAVTWQWKWTYIPVTNKIQVLPCLNPSSIYLSNSFEAASKSCEASTRSFARRAAGVSSGIGLGSANGGWNH